MWRTVGFAGFVGFQILLALGIGYKGGGWLDGKLGTAPWLRLVGTIAEVGAAISVLMTVIRQYNASLKDDDSSKTQKR